MQRLGEDEECRGRDEQQQGREHRGALFNAPCSKGKQAGEGR